VSPKSGTAAAGGRPLQPLIHGRVRLLVLSRLVKSGPSTFLELRAELGLTDGTLSVHLSRLAEGGVVELEKRFVGRKPQTVVKLTRGGRTRFKRYVRELREIVPGVADDD